MKGIFASIAAAAFCAVAAFAASRTPHNVDDYSPGDYPDMASRAKNTLAHSYLPNRMFEKIAAKKTAFGGYVSLADPEICEAAGLSGLDFVWIDMEHSPLTVKDIRLMQIALNGTGCASLVRVRCEDINHVKPSLDVGVDGLIFPQISGVAAARRAVEACRYPQAGGKRGICVSRQSGYGKTPLYDYLKKSETWPLIVIELEDEAAIREVDAILELPDVDAIMVGPSDLACSMGGLRQQQTPSVQDLVAEVARKTNAAGKLFFALGGLGRAKELNAGLCCGPGDIGSIVGTWKQFLKEANEVFTK